jgi:hypothetical protein
LNDGSQHNLYQFLTVKDRGEQQAGFMERGQLINAAL